MLQACKRYYQPNVLFWTMIGKLDIASYPYYVIRWYPAIWYENRPIWYDIWYLEPWWHHDLHQGDLNVSRSTLVRMCKHSGCLIDDGQCSCSWIRVRWLVESCKFMFHNLGSHFYCHGHLNESSFILSGSSISLVLTLSNMVSSLCVGTGSKGV